MTAAHTPGPWTVRRPLGGVHGGYPYQITNTEKPAKIITAWGAISRRASAEGEANARLIASAPDLLEALISTRASLQAMADEGIVAEGSWPTIDAAIQKATGR